MVKNKICLLASQPRFLISYFLAYPWVEAGIAKICFPRFPRHSVGCVVSFDLTAPGKVLQKKEKCCSVPSAPAGSYYGPFWPETPNTNLPLCPARVQDHERPWIMSGLWYRIYIVARWWRCSPEKQVDL